MSQNEELEAEPSLGYRRERLGSLVLDCVKDIPEDEIMGSNEAEASLSLSNDTPYFDYNSRASRAS
jgi:hypothetical protein